MNTGLLAEALKLSPSDRLQLIEALWDTLSEADIPVTAGTPDASRWLFVAILAQWSTRDSLAFCGNHIESGCP